MQRTSANTKASSMAIQPPSPMCGGPACAASPIRTTRPRYHSSTSTHSMGPKWELLVRLQGSEIRRNRRAESSKAASEAFEASDEGIR